MSVGEVARRPLRVREGGDPCFAAAKPVVGQLLETSKPLSSFSGKQAVVKQIVTVFSKVLEE